MEINTKKLSISELIAFKKIEYSRYQATRCPLLNDAMIHFNNAGFFHLTHDGRNRIRNEADQRMRLNLMSDVVTVIKKSRDFGSPTRIVPASQNRYKKEIIFYELFYRFSSRKAVSVIIRKVGNGQLHYYSVRYSTGIKQPKKRP